MAVLWEKNTGIQLPVTYINTDYSVYTNTDHFKIWCLQNRSQDSNYSFAGSKCTQSSHLLSYNLNNTHIKGVFHSFFIFKLYGNQKHTVSIYNVPTKDDSFPTGLFTTPLRHPLRHCYLQGLHLPVCIGVLWGWTKAITEIKMTSQRKRSVSNVHINIKSFTVNLHIGNMTHSQFKKSQSPE